MFVLPTQPMTFMDAIRNSFKLWWATLGSVLPLSIVSALLGTWPFLLEIKTHQDLIIVGVILINIINLIPYGALIAKIDHAAHGQPIKTSQGLAISLTKLPSMIAWLMIIIGVMVLMMGMLYGGSVLDTSHSSVMFGILFSGAMLLLIFAMVYSIYTLCVFPAIILENLSVLDAIRRSLFLTKGQWLYGGTFLSIIVLVTIFLSAPIEFLLGKVGSVVMSCFLISLNVSAIIVFYEHLKLRAEKK